MYLEYVTKGAASTLLSLSPLHEKNSKNSDIRTTRLRSWNENWYHEVTERHGISLDPQSLWYGPIGKGGFRTSPPITSVGISIHLSPSLSAVGIRT